MLKNKKAIYILVPLNIAIWCYLGYSIYSGLKEDELPEFSESNNKIKLDELKDTVTYRLILNYSDPFLKDGEKVNSHSNSTLAGNNGRKNAQINSNKTQTIAAVKPLAEIKYLGLVKNNSTGNSTALISINGKSHTVKKGDIIDGITVKNISNETIEFKDGKKTMMVSKN